VNHIHVFPRGDFPRAWHTNDHDAVAEGNAKTKRPDWRSISGTARSAFIARVSGAKQV